MTIEQVYRSLKEGLHQIIRQNGLSASRIDITCRALSPEEAIGATVRKDFPILTGKEIMIQATYMGSHGQAFTDSPAVFSGNLDEILHLDIVGDTHARGLFTAALNAVMRHAGLIEKTIHCKDGDPEICARKFIPYIKENYGNPKTALIGYQPALMENLSEAFDLRVLDLNPENIGKTRFGTRIENGTDSYEDAVLHWAELVLCTGSTLCNGSIVNFMDTGKDVVFFGTTLAGAAHILGLKRVCFCAA